jgi:hypothetical protein
MNNKYSRRIGKNAPGPPRELDVSGQNRDPPSSCHVPAIEQDVMALVLLSVGWHTNSNRQGDTMAVFSRHGDFCDYQQSRWLRNGVKAGMPFCRYVNKNRF